MHIPIFVLMLRYRVIFDKLSALQIIFNPLSNCRNTAYTNNIT